MPLLAACVVHDGTAAKVAGDAAMSGHGRRAGRLPGSSAADTLLAAQRQDPGRRVLLEQNTHTGHHAPAGST